MHTAGTRLPARTRLPDPVATKNRNRVDGYPSPWHCPRVPKTQLRKKHYPIPVLSTGTRGQQALQISNDIEVI